MLETSYFFPDFLAWMSLARAMPIADGSIALVFYSVPLTLAYFAYKRRSIPVNEITFLSVALALAGGTVALGRAWGLEEATSGMMAAFYGLASVLGVLLALRLLPLTPKLLAIPSHVQLSLVNQVLLNEVNERKQAQLAQAKLTAIVEATTDIAIVTDLQGYVVYANRAAREALGLPSREEELERSRFVDFLRSPADAESQIWQMASDRGVWSGEATLRSSGGKEIFVSQVILAHRSEDGAVHHFSAIARDIGDRMRAEAALKQLNEELEVRVEQRTQELKQTLEYLQEEVRERKEAEKALCAFQAKLTDRNHQLEKTLRDLRAAQSQLVHSEKMSSLGQMVAGIAHEINNPIGFIYGNLPYVAAYARDILSLVELYQQQGTEVTAEIAECLHEIDFAFLREDLPQLIGSMQQGTERIREIVLSLRNFVRLDESEFKFADLHEGLDSTLLILNNRLKGGGRQNAIRVEKVYGQLQAIPCYPGQLNQVFMHVLANAIDAFGEESDRPDATEPTIRIQTAPKGEGVEIRISDNGPGMTPDTVSRMFDPFFTTKPPGRGTGLGLFVSYQIVVESHGGELLCRSTLGRGTEFLIRVPGPEPVLANASGERQDGDRSACLEAV